MPDTLSNMKVLFQISALYQNALSNSAGNVSWELDEKQTLTFTDGTTDSKADKVWASLARSLSGATSESIDLYDFGALDIGAGAGNDPGGQALTLAEIAALVIFNRSTSTGNLTIGAEGSAAAWNTIFGGADDAAIGPIPPNGIFVIGTTADAAFAVADTSNHLLKIASSDDLTYDIMLLGRSA